MEDMKALFDGQPGGASVSKKDKKLPTATTTTTDLPA
jgi:hypothetical protein